MATAFGKAYFPNTRFSADFDFSTEEALDRDATLIEFNRACDFVQKHTGIVFETDRSRIEVQQQLDAKRRVLDARVYFKDFYGNADHISLKLSFDITEFDRIYLPLQDRHLIHPYSDRDQCAGKVRCLKLEEMIANKLKCLLQRRHVPDVYDLVYSVFVNRDIAVDRGEVLGTFFRKTIYERSPGIARQLLLELPLLALRNAWGRYIIAPIEGSIDFDDALTRFQSIINELFADRTEASRAAQSFFPSSLRTPIMDAGADRRLIRLTYDGTRREVEPYSLAYKQRTDGHREEYFYVWDRTGGRTSGPGIKSLLNHKIKDLEVLPDKFEPRFPIELAKAGEFGARTYFSKPFGSGKKATGGSRWSTLRRGWRYTVQCMYCSRRFKRMRRDTTLRSHKDGYGNTCAGRRGTIVSQDYI